MQRLLAVWAAVVAAMACRVLAKQRSLVFRLHGVP